jgi:hypothetical protein
MSKKTNHIAVTKRVNWALTCKTLMPVNYWTFKKDGSEYVTNLAYTYYYPIDGVISFKNHMHLMVQLTPATHQLLLYLTQHMNPVTNEINYDPSARLYFIEFMKSKCGVKIEDATVLRSLGVLKKVGYIIKRSKAKRLIINPRYYYRGAMKEREQLFRELLYEATHPKSKNNDIKKKLGLEF